MTGPYDVTHSDGTTRTLAGFTTGNAETMHIAALVEIANALWAIHETLDSGELGANLTSIERTLQSMQTEIRELGTPRP